VSSNPRENESSIVVIITIQQFTDYIKSIHHGHTPLSLGTISDGNSSSLHDRQPYWLQWCNSIRSSSLLPQTQDPDNLVW